MPSSTTSPISSILPMYIFRVLHIGSMITLSYKIIKDWQSKNLSIDHALFYSIIGIITMASGFINTFLLKPKRMGQNRKLWISWNHIKLLITLIMFTPIYKFIPLLNTQIINSRFAWLIILVILSPAARFYREYFTKKHQSKEGKNE